MTVTEKTCFIQGIEKKQNLIFWLMLSVIMAVGGILYFRTTPHGVGLVSDSVNYINGARSIAAGNGYFRESGGGILKPITNFPPLYSILLSIPFWLKADWFAAVRYFGLIFFMLNLGLTGILVHAMVKNIWFGLGAALLMLVSKPFLYFQVFAMSESLFFFCTLASFLFFVFALETEKQRNWFLCGLFSGFAFLTRYVGIISLFSILSVLMLNRRTKNTLKSMLWLLIGAVPLISAWLIRNVIVSGNASNREFFFHPLSGEEIKGGILIFWKWIFPIRYQNVEQTVFWMEWIVIGLALAGFLFLVILFLLSLKKSTIFPASIKWLWVFVVYILSYLAFIWATISFFDASVNIEERILYPVFMVMILFVFTVAKFILQRKKWFLQLALLGLYGFFIIAFSQDLIRFVPKFQSEGYGWAWEGWRTSPAMQIIQDIPSEIMIYSNQPEAVSLWAGRGSFALLDPIDPSTNLPRADYSDTIERIRSQVLEGQSVLVFFGIDSWIGVDSNNWITELCDALPMIYQDSSEWVVGRKGIIEK